MRIKTRISRIGRSFHLTAPVELSLEQRIFQLEMEQRLQRVKETSPAAVLRSETLMNSQPDSSNDSVLYLYGNVVASGWEDLMPFDAFSSATVRAFLKGKEGQDLTIRINSPGGLASEGASIYNLLKDHKGKLTTRVDGMCASAATLPFLAGEDRVMGVASLMMIHSPSLMVIGDHKTLRDTARRLEKSTDTYASLYELESNLDRKEVRAAMDAETFYTGDEAVEAGFATETAADDDSVTTDAAKAQACQNMREQAEYLREIELSRFDYLRN